MENRLAAINSLSHLLAELVRGGFSYKGTVVTSMSPTSEALWGILHDSKISEAQCKYFFSLFYNDKFSELEEELINLEYKLM